MQHAVEEPDVEDHAAVDVVDAVEDEGLERLVLGAGRRRYALDDRREDLVDALAGLGAREQHLGGVDPERLLHLLHDLFGPGGGEVDLVDDGDDREVVVDGLEGVGDGLGLDALGGVDEEERPFAAASDRETS